MDILLSICHVRSEHDCVPQTEAEDPLFTEVIRNALIKKRHEKREEIQ